MSASFEAPTVLTQRPRRGSMVVAAPPRIENQDGLLQIISNPAQAAQVARAAEADFLSRLSLGGLTVTPEALKRWWPLAHPSKEAR